MKLNNGVLLIEALVAVLVCAIIVNLVVSLLKLQEVEKSIYETHEQRIYDD